MLKYWILFALSARLAAREVTSRTQCEKAVSTGPWTDCETNFAFCNSKTGWSCCQRKLASCPTYCRAECGFTYKWITRPCVCREQADNSTFARQYYELLLGSRGSTQRSSTQLVTNRTTQRQTTQNSLTSVSPVSVTYKILNKTHSRLLPDALCGLRDTNETAQFRVLGGIAAVRGSWRWSVALVNHRDLSQVFCGGTLIASQWVLTAAHCLHDASGRARSFKLVLAEYDRTVNERNEIYRTVDAVYTPPGYTQFSTTHDVALIRLDQAVNRSSFVDFACLPDADFLLSLSYKCFATGWGRTHVLSDYPAHLREVELPLVPWNECRTYYPKLTRRQLCAGAVGRKTARDTCTGDSGGGLLCKVQVHQSHRSGQSDFKSVQASLSATGGTDTLRTRERDSVRSDDVSIVSERWFVYGVTSFGDGCGTKFGVYQRVSAFIDWIKEVAAL